MEKHLLIICLAFFLLMGCREPFDIELDQSGFSVLVIEGFIEVAGKESVINLSRTAPLGQAQSSLPETRAIVVLEDESTRTWSFTEDSPGVYTFTGFLDFNNRYKLKIKTGNGKEYSSEYIKPYISPDIQEIGYHRHEEGVSIYVNTQGDTENSYFIWDFEETWNFRSGIISGYIYDKDTDRVLFRTPEQKTDLCWKSAVSADIVMEHSRRFGDNFIFQKEIQRIPNLSEKLGLRYSILVRQRVLDREAYSFWEIMKKNSDDLSGIFSPLPSILRSNIANVKDPSESVIGYISMGSSTEQRFYISNTEIRPWRIFIPEYEDCTYSRDTIPPRLYQGTFGGGGYVPVEAITQGLTVLGYTGGLTRCTDCTLRGTKEKPEYWEDGF